MSTKSKLLAMTENLDLPTPVPPAAPRGTGGATAGEGAKAPDADSALSAGHRFPPVLPGGVPRTGPGQMLQFRGHMLAAEGELSDLRKQLKTHEGSAPTRRLDASTVAASRWANRHADSFESAEFARLKQDIELAGGNVQPISVRPSADQMGTYEIIFGHRRHRACSELGLPVLATIELNAMSDLELFSAMDRENRARADLSTYEQGAMYRRALDEKLYPSNRRLAEALGVSHTWVANVLQVADLPTPVLDCFRSRLEIQPRHAKALVSALEADRKGLLRRAEKLRAQDTKRPATVVVSALLGQSAERTARRYQPLGAEGNEIGRWSVDEAGRLVFEIEVAFANAAHKDAIVASVVAALK